MLFYFIYDEELVNIFLILIKINHYLSLICNYKLFVLKIIINDLLLIFL